MQKKNILISVTISFIFLLTSCTSSIKENTAPTPTLTPTVAPTLTVTPTPAATAEIADNSTLHTNETVKGKYSDTESVYIGNKQSKKFHSTDCCTLPKEKNRVKLNSRDEAMNKGYRPCGNCNP